MVVNFLNESLYSGTKHFRVNGFIKDADGSEKAVSTKIFNVKNANDAKHVSLHLYGLSHKNYRVDNAHELSEDDESDLTEGFFKKDTPPKYSKEDIHAALKSFNENKIKTVNALKVKSLDAFTAKHKGNTNHADFDADLNKLHWHVYRSLDKHLNNIFTPNEIQLIHGLHENTVVDNIFKNQSHPEYEKLINKLKKYKPLSNTPTTT